MDNINTFEVSKSWFSYVAENVNVKPIHTALYFFIFNKWNSLFWKKHFGLPTENTMECLNIRSYKTYIKALEELESFGFIKFIERSKNQNTSNIIEVVNNTKANTKATTKALLKATNQSDNQSDNQSSVSVIKQYNKEQINQLTKNHLKVKVFLKSLEDENKVFAKPTIEDIKKYTLDKGYEVDANKIWHYYNDNNWKDAKGNQVINWKTKILNNWCKEENKVKPKPFSVGDYDIPNDDLFGYSNNEIAKRCKEGKYPKIV